MMKTVSQIRSNASCCMRVGLPRSSEGPRLADPHPSWHARLAVLLAVGAVGALGCIWGRGPDPNQCKLKVTGLEEWQVGSRGVDAAFRVRGTAGSRAVVWLAAERPTGGYISGKGVEVGPGEFQAIVDLDLTAVPKGFRAILEVNGRRCSADTDVPD